MTTANGHMLRETPSASVTGTTCGSSAPASPGCAPAACAAGGPQTLGVSGRSRGVAGFRPWYTSAMTYRDPPVEPLIVVGSLGLLALSPVDGAQVWQLNFAAHGIGTQGYTRVARLAELLVFTNGEQVVFVDAHTGELRARHALTFRVQQLVANPPYVAAVGLDGLACFHRAQLAWRVEATQRRSGAGGWFAESTTTWALYDGAGRFVRQLDLWPNTGSVSDMALMLGGAVAQADHNT